MRCGRAARAPCKLYTESTEVSAVKALISKATVAKALSTSAERL